jgi:hypothetical protein
MLFLAIFFWKQFWPSISEIAVKAALKVGVLILQVMIEQWWHFFGCEPFLNEVVPLY